MSTILDLSGKPAAAAQTSVKKAHDPEELKRVRHMLQSTYQTCMKGFAEDMSPERNGGVEPDYEKVRDHWAEKYREQARTVNATGFPHKVNEDQVLNTIEDGWKRNQREMAMSKPLHELDLSEWELSLVGAVDGGTLWLSTVCAVWHTPTGQCRVWVRKPGEGMAEWMSCWMPQVERDADVESEAYTMAELHALLAALRIVRIAALTEDQLMLVRGAAKSGFWSRLLNN